MHVTVWGENLHEQRQAGVVKHYPRGMHTTIAEGIQELLGDRKRVRTTTLDQPEHGLSSDMLASTDVLTRAIAWASTTTLRRVHERVLLGMG